MAGIEPPAVTAQEGSHSTISIEALAERFEDVINHHPTLREEMVNELHARAKELQVIEGTPQVSAPSTRGCVGISLAGEPGLFGLSFQTNAPVTTTGDVSEPLLDEGSSCLMHHFMVSMPQGSPRLPIEVAEILDQSMAPTAPPTPTPTPTPYPGANSPAALAVQAYQARLDCYPLPKKRSPIEGFGWYDYSYDRDPEERFTRVNVSAGGRWLELGGSGDWRLGDIFYGTFERDAAAGRTDMNMNLAFGLSGNIGGYRVSFGCLLVDDSFLPTGF